MVATDINVVILSGEREVNVGGVPCLCGGTHVQNTSEIVSMNVTRIKKVCLSSGTILHTVLYRIRRISKYLIQYMYRITTYNKSIILLITITNFICCANN